MKKILMIGQFPGQLNGLTIANATLEDGLKKEYKVEKINLSLTEEFSNKSEQGKFRLKKFTVIIFKQIKELKSIWKSDIDIIYMTPGQSFLGYMRFSPYMIICILKKIPYYNHIHGGFFRTMYNSQNFFYKKILNFFIKNSAGMIVLGESLKTMFKGLTLEERIFICENGVQDEFVATEQEIKEKIEIYKKDNKKRVLYLSNLMIEKGILDLLKVSERFSDSEIEFNLAGAIEPSIKNIIEDYLKRYPQKIKYHGIVRGIEKKKLLLENYIFILPTYYSNEGQPISILEAYANGCSVITDSKVGGIEDIFVNKINGENIRNRNLDDIFNKLNIINEKEYFEKNYRLFLKKYTKNMFVKKIEKIMF